MKRSSAWIGVLAAGGLLVAGCSSGGDTVASATVASTPSSSSSSSSSSSASSSSKSSAEESTAVSAATLDAETETWFSTFCTSLGDIAQYTGPDTAGQSLTEVQATVVAAYTGISTSATKAAATLQATPPPTIDGGAPIAAATVTGFQTLADVYGRGAQTIAALTPSSEADLKTAVEAVETEAQASAPQSLSDVDADVKAAAKELPECAGVIGS